MDLLRSVPKSPYNLSTRSPPTQIRSVLTSPSVTVVQHTRTFPSAVLQYNRRWEGTCPRLGPATPAASIAPVTKASPMSSETCERGHPDFE